MWAWQGKELSTTTYPSKSEVIGHCGVDEKTEWPRRTDNSRTLKTFLKNVLKLHSDNDTLNT